MSWGEKWQKYQWKWNISYCFLNPTSFTYILVEKYLGGDNRSKGEKWDTFIHTHTILISRILWFISSFFSTSNCLRIRTMPSNSLLHPFILLTLIVYYLTGILLGPRTQQWMKKTKIVTLFICHNAFHNVHASEWRSWPQTRHARNGNACISIKEMYFTASFLYFFWRLNWCLIWKASSSSVWPSY